MEWYIASDHAGFDLKQDLLRVTSGGVDLGTHSKDSCDYPDFAHELSRKVLEKKCFGVLICGSGVGVSIAANRHKGIRAALCFSEEIAELARKHNDANVLCLGARFLDSANALKIFQKFMMTDFEGGRHLRRVTKIDSFSG